MAGVIVDPAAVVANGAQVAGAASDSVPGVGPISPPAPDSVSTAIAETLQARVGALVAYRAAAHQIIQTMGSMLTASGTAYAGQETANQTGLTLGAAAPTTVGAPPITSAPVAPLPPVDIPAVMVGPPPTDGKNLATLIHPGDPAPWYSTAHLLRQQGSELDDTADQLRASGAWVEADWQSSAGTAAATWFRKVAIWCDDHAGHFRSAARAFDTAADNFGRAKAATPSPQDFENLEQQRDTVRAAARVDRRYLPLLPVVDAKLANLHQQAITAGYTRYAAATEAANLTGDPIEPPPQPHNGHIHAVDLHTFKDAPHPEPDPPPGGWSQDPLMRAAQKIAYGHTSDPVDGHMGDFPGMTKDQLADLIYGKMKRSIENPTGLRLGVGAPVIYDRS